MQRLCTTSRLSSRRAQKSTDEAVRFRRGLPVPVWVGEASQSDCAGGTTQGHSDAVAEDEPAGLETALGQQVLGMVAALGARGFHVDDVHEARVVAMCKRQSSTPRSSVLGALGWSLPPCGSACLPAPLGS
eukprot:14971206-Alexandrium_andersonii.AAC.1